ncbi:zinc-dependent alcohol dehydrogenase [Cohnella fermenti]|uniref:Galactitol-1-phosphate 5-dehydrogenase n=1 Tax=Cohnella fermenti TaxID=2565925 RepID=A0A4S4C3S7_9BACL|nr:alcohol dehydrogenase catalytic domain-containing protein [Cohnella fermenti]THF82173.1 galactitol-1-phosphate 5-dehydrogenase [Cohnella fermenti]
MRALVWHGPQVLALEETKRPEPGPGELLLRVDAVGICGSELEGYRGHSAVRQAPLVMGHEFAGTVVAVGTSVGAEPLAAGAGSGADSLLGRRVVVNPLLACGVCPRCLEGRPNVCRQRRIVGIHRPGAFADYVTVPSRSAILLPDGMDAALASLAEPLAVCVHGLRLGTPEGASPPDLLVLGAGPIGLLALQAARAAGTGRALVVDRQPPRLAVARALGAEACLPEEAEAVCRELFGEDGPGTAVDAVGVRQTREAAIRLVGAGGRVVLVGLGQDDSLLPMNLAVRKELALLGSYTYDEAEFAEAIRLLETGAIAMEGWTAQCGLEEAAAVFAALDRGDSPFIKVIVRP